MWYIATVNLYNVDGFETGKLKPEKENVEKSFLLIEKQSLSFGPVSFQPPTVVEVDRFPSGSITLNKDTVGEHGQYFEWFYSTYLH